MKCVVYWEMCRNNRVSAVITKIDELYLDGKISSSIIEISYGKVWIGAHHKLRCLKVWKLGTQAFLTRINSMQSIYCEKLTAATPTEIIVSLKRSFFFCKRWTTPIEMIPITHTCFCNFQTFFRLNCQKGRWTRCTIPW